jgi:glycosyltransferase involved in cell wall biosynthesis
MKITLLQGAFFPVPPILGGAVEKMWFRLGHEFAARGHEVVQVSRAHPDLPEREILGGVEHRRVRGYSQPGNLLQLKFLDLLYTLRAVAKVPDNSDVVVTNTFWAPWLLRGGLKSRAYVDVQRMPKGQCRWYGRAGRLRANSSPVADAIRAEVPVSRQPRIVMIPNPLPFDPLPEPDLTAKRPCLLYTGRVHPEKGLHLLLQAMAKLPEPWALAVVGPWATGQGGGGEMYRQQLQKLAPAGRVTFHGPVYDPERLAAHYAKARVFVYPSLAEQGETFGLAPLEAMAHGAVPVVSNLACFQDFITHDQNGWIFDHRAADPAEKLADALRTLTADTQRLDRLAAAAWKVNETHAPGRIAELFLADFAALRR